MDSLTKFVDFIEELFKSLSNGYLFFGSIADLIRSFCDIALIAFLVYWALVFIKHSRAWQLIKGIIFVYAFVFLCSLFGLQMVGFLFSNFLYIFAIMFVVIFQPELRRALETVGIKSFTSIRDVVVGNSVENKDQAVTLIDEICDACNEMCKTYTGALMLLERNTKLDELMTQENAVSLEATVTSMFLQSLFYKGAPMHDGAALIRDGKVIAARCHINAPVTLHQLERSGTRHKAAVAASEMGDTIAIAVSEERGKTSIALNGQLYEMKNTNELRANLMYLFGLSDVNENKKGIGGAIKGLSKKKSSKASANTTKVVVAQSEPEVSSEKPNMANGIKNFEKVNNRASASEKVMLLVVSILISTGLWIYIQINNNPVVNKHYTVPITYTNESLNYQVSYPVDTVEVTIVGRQKTLEKITANSISATIDFSGIEESGVFECPVIVESKDSKTYFRVEQQIPGNISVTVFK